MKRSALSAVLPGDWSGLLVSSFTKPSILKGSSTGTVLLEIPGKPASAATLSLANPPRGRPQARAGKPPPPQFPVNPGAETLRIFHSPPRQGSRHKQDKANKYG